MSAEFWLILGINAVVLGLVGVLFWQRHSARHREIAAEMETRFTAVIAGLGERAGATHDHPHSHSHSHPEHALLEHEHPHQHEHIQHTHTLEKLSEHEENGRKVVVKRCGDCQTIFRDRAEQPDT